MPYSNYNGNDKIITSFIKLPMPLFTDEKLKKLSTDDKLLYTLLLCRVGNFAKLNWIEKDKRGYVNCTIEEVMDRIQFSKDRAVKILDELDTQKGVGLIERKRQGLAVPS